MAVVPQDLVENLRNAFLKDVEAKGLESVHPKDLERVKRSDHWLQRFLRHNELNVEKALQMLWTSVTWRKDFGVNEINESTVKMEILAQGGFFPHGKDIDGCSILIFKCKRHTKGNVDSNDLKRCVVYWFERIERQTKGEQISLFFDMENCGLSNMDMDIVKYLIGLFKEYYPFFLNYILIFEMPWVLSAAFKIIKSWLPEKAIEKIKFVNKKDIFTYVPSDQALTCWGGENEYVFRFIPEPVESEKSPPMNRKVHFVDGSLMSEVSSNNIIEKDEGPLKVVPSGIVTFVREGSELVSTLELQNTDASAHLSFKLKTTTPEKFRVKPSSGYLVPGASRSITLTLLPGFQLGGLSKDKFLVMSTIVDEKETNALDVSDLWKNTNERKIHQHRLRCIQSGEVTKNGNVVPIGSTSSEPDNNSLSKLSSAVAKFTTCQAELHESIKKVRNLQIVTSVLLVIVLFLGIFTSYVLYTGLGDISDKNSLYCSKTNNQLKNTEL